MKRFFICAAAAIVALASCSKTEVVNTSAPEEIGFKAVTGAITKAEQDAATLDGTMGVFAFVHGESTSYFSNTSFSDKGTYWGGTAAPMYWPVTSGLDFAVYAPYQASGASATNTSLTVDTDNSENTTIGTQTDYLYGAAYYNNEGAGYDKDTESVPVTLNHAQAKVTVSFTGENVTVTSVKLDAPVLKGSYTVNYSDNPVKPDWTPGEANTAVTLISEAELTDVPTTASLLVVPETTSTITFTYQIKGSATTLDYTITPAANWAYGTHYEYSVTVNPKEIKFEPSVSFGWTTGATTGTTL